jgi:cytochrome c oxidase cbb3-type subunit 3
MHTACRPARERAGGLIVVWAVCLVIKVAAQAPAGPPPGQPVFRFPAQQRPPDDPELVMRGKRVYDISCRGCHGADLRGGDMGGPNLLRSDVMLNDQLGEQLRPILQGGRAGMPAIDLAADDGVAVAVYVHSVLAQGRAQGAPPAAPSVALNILVGDAVQGQAFFTQTCSTCHSVTGDLEGIGRRVADPVQLQNLWVGGGRQEPRDFNSEASPRDVTAVVSLPAGRRAEGRLDRIDDFSVTLVLADGRRQTFRRTGQTPAIEIRDPLATHRELLPLYTDRNIHDVTAYLVTVK